MASFPSSCPHCQAQFQRDGATNDRAVACPACGGLVKGAGGSATELLWFYVKNKQKIGPVTRADLRQLVASGQLQPTDMVLQESASKWMAVSAIEGLVPASAEATVVLFPDGLKMPTTTNPRQPTLAKAPVVPPADHPQHIGRYRVEKILGEGGFGVVYLGYDEELHRPVAIKVLHRHRVSHPKAAEAYLTEARILASLDHPHIVPVYDVGRAERGLCFVVSKFIEGSDLAKKIKETRLSAREAATVVATVAGALHYAHQKGLTHRDVKSANILLDGTGKTYLTDFGLALKEEDVGQGSESAGTPAYMSPEQAKGEGHRLDGRSDIYSLGVVLYELLTGQRPFVGESVVDLLLRIMADEPVPPRQVDETIPKELERICLKAMAKRASDRYARACDLAEELRHWQSALAGGESTRPHRPIVPKGLRSFDTNDADFFVDLLPGPRDRHGLPESIRFWKTRIEAQDREPTFSVGLLYGPSGCGKSSLVKAGLLPLLADHVRVVYLEATASGTESRLLHGLRKHGLDLSPDLGLPETLTALRRGQGIAPGKKILIILDQFEQWLHAQQPEETTELVRALRQCDSERVQAVIMVRDDFWLAATRFMHALEIRLIEGENSAVVDLFDCRHGRRVLAALGRAFGRVAEGAPNPDQELFLDQAIAGLAQEGKVIPVQLALFAEMVKSQPWTPSTLKEAGGTEGIGVTFLEETFSARTAQRKHRFHQQAARAVLQALLPETGSDIKGNMRSHPELLAASGYAIRPHDFEELLHILDAELRLITPTDPEGPDQTAKANVGGQYFQLTHDYLVRSLREWLTRKQKETRKGRAELRLAERAALWNARPENRHLPTWWEWLTIRLFTQAKHWTASQQKMMQQASRYLRLRSLVLVVVLGALLLTSLILRHELIDQNQATHAAGLVRRVLDAETAQVPGIVADMTPYRHWTDPLLQQAFQEAANDPHRQLNASLALLPVDPGQVDYLYQRLLTAAPTELSIIRDALRGHRDTLAERLWSEVSNSREPVDRRFRAACALAGYETSPSENRWGNVAKFVAERLLVAVQNDPSHYPVLVDQLRPTRHLLSAPLAEVCRDRLRPEADRSFAVSILADYAGDQPDLLVNLLMDADERSFVVLFPKVEAHRGSTVPVLEQVAAQSLEAQRTEEDREQLARRRSNAAVALLRLGEPAKVWPLFQHRPDPRTRSNLIHRLAPLGVDPGVILKRFDAERELSIRRALLLSLGEYDPDQLPAGQRAALLPKLLRLYEDEPDAGLHGTVEWLLRQWKQENQLKTIDQKLAMDRGDRQRHWYVNGQGQTMAIIRGPVEFLMGSPPTERGREEGPEGKLETQHKRRIGRSFAIAAKEVTVAQFLRFRRQHPYSKQFSPTEDHPINSITWYAAAAYCNWLSEMERIPKEQWCYEPNAQGQYDEGMKARPNYLRLQGYRLPTEAEWEYACRAGAMTSRYCGETEELLGKYAWYATNSQGRALLPVGSLKPNDFGLFDMLGNCGEWCHDQAEYYPSNLPGQAMEDTERPGDVLNRFARVLRSGSFTHQAINVRCASRNRTVPANQPNNVGFRPARTWN